MLVVVNKVDRSDARPAEVLDAVYDLFIDLGADEYQIDFPVVYCNARSGQAALSAEEVADAPGLKVLFELLVEHIPAPCVHRGPPVPGAGRQPGRLALRRPAGHLPGPPGLGAQGRHGGLVPPRRDGAPQRARIAELYMTDALHRVDAGPKGAGPGDIIAVAGIPDDHDRRHPRRRHGPAAPARRHRRRASHLHDVRGQHLSAGRPGRHQAHGPPAEGPPRRRAGRQRLHPGAAHERPDTWEVQGRGELALAVLVELMRREGFELTVGKPQVLTKLIDGKVYEPVERVSLDIPEEHLGTVTQLLAGRKGRMEHVVSHGSGWAAPTGWSRRAP